MEDEQEAPILERREVNPENAFKRSVFAVPVNVQVCVGTANPSVSDLLQLKQGSLLKLGSKIDDPIELRIGSQVIARGELTEIDDEPGRLGVRLTEIVDISQDSLG